MNRYQPELRLVQIEELIFLLDEVQLAIGPVAPAVVFAHELATDATGFFARIVVPDELVSTWRQML